jgi:hypothetical protein
MAANMSQAPLPHRHAVSKSWHRHDDAQTLPKSARGTHLGPAAEQLVASERRVDEQSNPTRTRVSLRVRARNFTFVNHNAKHRSITNQDKWTINRHVREHVMKQSRIAHNEGRAESVDGYNTFLLSSVGHNPSTEDNALHHPEIEDRLRDVHEPELVNAEAGSLTVLPGNSDSSQISATAAKGYEQRRDQQVRQRYPKILPLPHSSSVLSRGNSDPFSCTAIPLIWQANRLMHSALDVFAQTLWPTKADPMSSGYDLATAAWSADMQHVVTEKATMHATLATGAYFIAMSRPGSRAEYTAEGLYHASRGLVAFQLRLQQYGFNDISLVATMWYLAAAEAYSGNLAAAYVHITAYERLIRSSGGLNRLSWTVRGNLVHSDACVALLQKTRPHWKADEFDPGGWALQPFAEDLELLPNYVSKYGSVKLDQLFSDIRELTIIRSVADQLSSPHSALLWANDRATAVKIRLLCHHVDLTEKSQRVEDRIEAALCITAARYLDFSLYQTVIPFIQMELSSYQRSFLQEMDEHWAFLALNERESLLWISSVAALSDVRAWRGGVDDHWIWHATHFKELSGRLRISSWETVNGVLSQYLFNQNLYKPLQEHWEEV